MYPVLCSKRTNRSLAIAQAGVGNPTINEPIAGPGQDASAADGQGHPAQEEPEADRIEPALKAIEAAIRKLVAKEDAEERKRQEERDEADLKAQKEMALWAKRMTWATWAGVGLTFVGLALIARTLHWTKQAAIAAGWAVKEAEIGTAAALKAVEVTRDMGGREHRAYVNAVDMHVTSFGIGRTAIFGLSIKNAGNTPANSVRMCTVVFPAKTPSSPVSFRDAKPESTAIISGNSIMPQSGMSLLIPPDLYDAISGGEATIIMAGYIRYRDVFKNRRGATFKTYLRLSDVVNGAGPMSAAQRNNYGN